MVESWDSVETLRTLRPETEILMNEKGKVVTELSDEKWLYYLTLLCDSSNYVNDSNTKSQGQQKFGAIRAFEMKLKQFRE
jgi:hypothetical protein